MELKWRQLPLHCSLLPFPLYLPLSPLSRSKRYTLTFCTDTHWHSCTLMVYQTLWRALGCVFPSVPLSTEVTGVSKGKIELAQAYPRLTFAFVAWDSHSNAPEKARLAGGGGWKEHWSGLIIDWGHSPNSVRTNKQEMPIGQNKTIPGQISQWFSCVMWILSELGTVIALLCWMIHHIAKLNLWDRPFFSQRAILKTHFLNRF